MSLQNTGFYIDSFEYPDFKHIKFIRENMYGLFSVWQLSQFIKQNPRQLVVLRHKDTGKQTLGYIILRIRDEDDCWIHQLGYTPLMPAEGLKTLLNYAESYFSNSPGVSRIRILVRDTQINLAQAILESKWRQIDTMAIYEKRDISNIPAYNIPDGIIIREAIAGKDLDGVVNVDRSAFRVGHRVPRVAIHNHLADAGSFVVIEQVSGNIVGYNYNNINTKIVGHFIRLATLENFKRQGIGSSLLHNALTWFHAFGISYVYLRAIPDSAGSKLYEKFGFSKIANENTYEFLINRH